MLTNLASYLEKNVIFEVLSIVCTLLNIQTNGHTTVISDYWSFGLMVASEHWDVHGVQSTAHCCKAKIN